MALDDAFGGTQQAYEGTQANIAAQQAMAQLHQAHALQATTSALQQQALMKALAQSDPGTAQASGALATSAQGGGDPALAQLNNLGDRLAGIANRVASVAPGEAAKWASEAAGIRLKTAEITNQQSNARIHQLTARMHQLDQMNGFLSSATDEPSYNAAILAYTAENPGEQIPPALQQYNPAVVERLKMGTKTGLAQVRADLAAQKEADRLEMAGQRLQFQQDREAFNESYKTSQAEAKERNRKVAGEKPPADPGPQTVKQALSMVADTYPDLSDADKEQYSRNIAFRAQALIKVNPGFDKQTALEQAMDESAKAGDIQKVNDAYKVFGMSAPKAVFDAAPDFSKRADARTTLRKGGGATGSFASDTLDLPASKADLKAGQIYNTARGKGRWNGTAFEKVN